MVRTNIQKDRQKNFKMSDGKNTHNGMTEKTKLFQRKNKYENRNAYSKAMVEHALIHI